MPSQSTGQVPQRMWRLLTPDGLYVLRSEAERVLWAEEGKWSADLSVFGREVQRVIEEAVDLIQENRVEDALQALINWLPPEA